MNSSTRSYHVGMVAGELCQLNIPAEVMDEINEASGQSPPTRARDPPYASLFLDVVGGEETPEGAPGAVYMIEFVPRRGATITERRWRRSRTPCWRWFRPDGLCQ
jgi:hypothetical protein